MNDLIKNFRETVEQYLDLEKINDEISISNAIDEMAQMSRYKDISNEDKELVKKQIHAKMSITLDKGVVIEEPYEYRRWFLNRKKNIDLKFWERYKKYLVKDKKFSRNVANRMDDISDELTDLLGDPTINECYQRKGLVIGDVQSGKTSNYNALICKAIDAGYKVIVLLTGTTDKLRTQTQKRVDEAIIGSDSDALLKGNTKKVGVGNYEIFPIGSFTTKAKDFNTVIANSMNFDLKFSSNPYVFVIKKNVSTLANLNKWFKVKNSNNNEKINNSLLVVDDEADYASINTNKEENDPTRTNKLIREMLTLFKKSSYVGFTATPYANVFIEPETEEDMKNEDLFPKNYIYCLEEPSNYIGSKKIFSDEASHGNMVIEIEDVEEYIPLKHKKEDVINDLPPSLKEAINAFLLSNVIRDLRGDTNSHRSMLINVSRFINTQNQIHTLVNNYLKEIQDAISVYSKLDEAEALQNRHIKTLYDIFAKEYQNLYKWQQIQSNLKQSTISVKSFVDNSGSKELDYEAYENSGGLRAIVTGGFTLSRGLTLEGLIVSYFYRNSKMYDTLMQMGRWFGYKDNYEDICRIYIDKDNIEAFKYINVATDDLKYELARMNELGKIPLDFGLRVRSDKNSVLMITARNKMRTASLAKRFISLSREVVETPYIYSDRKLNKKNFESIKELLIDIKEKESSKFAYKNVNKKHIIQLLNNISVPFANIHFNNKDLAKFINNYSGEELNKWDIVFINGSSKEIIIDGKTLKLNVRKQELEKRFNPSK